MVDHMIFLNFKNVYQTGVRWYGFAIADAAFDVSRGILNGRDFPITGNILDDVFLKKLERNFRYH